MADPVFTLSTLAGGVPSLMEKFMSDPSIVASNKVSNNVAAAVMRLIIEREATTHATAIAVPVVREAYDMYVMMNGAFDENADQAVKDDWESGLDDAIEAAFEPYKEALSASFLGEYTVDTRLHLGEEHFDRLCAAFGNTVFNGLIYDDEDDERPVLSDAKICSRAGIGMKLMRDELDAREPITEEQQKEHKTMSLNETLTKLRACAGAEFNRNDYMDYMENAIDSDDGLAQSGISFMGGDMDDVRALREEAKNHGAAAAAALVEMLEALPFNATPAAPAPAEAPAPASADDLDMSAFMTAPAEPEATPAPAPAGAVAADSGDEFDMSEFMQPSTPAEAPPAPVVTTETTEAPPPRKRAKAAPLGAPGSLAPELLLTIKAATGAADQDFANAIGVSRATWNNYLKGKAAFVPDETQRQYVRTFVEERIAALNTVLPLL